MLYKDTVDVNESLSITTVYVKDQIAGEVLSGGFSPLIQCPIGSAFVKSKFLPEINQQKCFADVRGHKVSIKFGKPALKRRE